MLYIFGSWWLRSKIGSCKDELGLLRIEIIAEGAKIVLSSKGKKTQKELYKILPSVEPTKFHWIDPNP